MSRPALAASPTTAFRPVDLGPLDVAIELGRDGDFYARSPFALGNYEAKATLWLDRWAALRPDHIFLGERRHGAWETITYAETRRKAHALAQALLGRGLSAERPLAILSGNSIAHALLSLAALYAGIPHAPLSPAYSLASQDFARLRNIVDLLTPGLVFAEDGALYAQALASLPPEMPRLVCTSPAPDADIFDTLLTTKETSALDRANMTVGPETIAKFMFTSGSTAAPKAVVTTHRMLCANQAMIAHCCAFLTAGRRCSSIGCHGVIVSAATRISISCSRTAARFISTAGGRRRKASQRRSPICAMSRRHCISTFPPVLKRFCRISPTTERLQQISFVTCG